MSLYAFRGALELGLIYGIMTLGLFISYRILNIADLTVDGSFVLGAVVSVTLTVAGYPILGILLALLAGGLAGLVTGLLQTKLGIKSILAGILTMTGLYSINLRILSNKPNVSLLNIDNIFTPFEKYGVLSKIILIAIIVIIIVLILNWFFKTQIGLSLRATGDNEDMVRSSSISTTKMKIIGLSIANAIVAMSGGLIAQYQGFGDVNMGIGIVVIGLASLIIGESIIGRKSISHNIIAVIIGAIIYRIIIALVLNTRISTSDLKIISAIIVTIAISYPNVKERWVSNHAKNK